MTEIQSQPSVNSSPRNKNIPIELMIHYVDEMGLTITETARKLGCHKTNVSKRLKAAGFVPGYLQSIDSAEVSILKQVRHRILKQASTLDLKKARITELSTAYGTFLDKQHLIEGKPTSIQAYADMVRAQEIHDKNIQAFKDKYNMDPADIINVDGKD